MISYFNVDYFKKVFEGSGATQKKVNLLENTIKHLASVKGFLKRTPKDPKTQGKREERADRLRLELIEVCSQMNLNFDDKDLIKQLSARGKIYEKRKMDSYNNIIDGFLSEFIDAGITKSEWNKKHRPSLMRFLKQKNKPFHDILNEAGVTKTLWNKVYKADLTTYLGSEQPSNSKLNEAGITINEWSRINKSSLVQYLNDGICDPYNLSDDWSIYYEMKRYVSIDGQISETYQIPQKK